MKYWKSLIAITFAAATVLVAHHQQGWPGVLGVSGAIVFAFLLYINRITKVLRIASNTPKGAISSAVMLNARLKPGWSMIEVMRQTRSFGEPQTAENTEPAVFRWTDPGGASVDCTFVQGRLQSWSLQRPLNA